jgi:hypothetical protein
MGSTDPGVLAEQKKVVGLFVDAMTKAGAKISDYDVTKALTGDPATRDAMLGTLLPFIFQELTDILALDAAKRTPQQTAYLATVEKYIQDQKTAAADEGMRQFQAWKTAEAKKMQDSASGIGVAGVYMSMIEAANPEGPPQDFLNQAQSGMVLTNGQLKSFVAVNDRIAKMGEQAKAEAKALDTDQVRQAVARMEMDRLGDLALKPGLSIDKRNALMDKYNKAVADYYSTDPAKKAQADKALDALYKEYNLPIIGALEVSSVVNIPGSSSGLKVGDLPGAIADAGRLLTIVNYAAGGGMESTKLVGEGSKILDKLLPHAQETKVRLGQKAKISDKENVKLVEIEKTEEVVGDTTKTVSKSTEISDEALSIGSKIAKVAEVAGEVLAVGGVVLEVVGNLVQIGVGVAGYASIGLYENQIIDAQKAAKTAVTANDLKGMDSNTLYSYLNAMLITGGQVGGK